MKVLCDNCLCEMHPYESRYYTSQRAVILMTCDQCKDSIHPGERAWRKADKPAFEEP